MTGPLHGVRIVDMTNVVMGPYATRILGDYGADVIKVETPAGDSTRRLGAARHAGMGAYYMNLNRNKRSLAIDLKKADGIAALRKLIDSADVLISNIRPRALQRLGLSYESLATTNPRLIYVSLVGYGQDGPYGPRPAYDDLMQGATAVTALFAEATGGEPRFVPFNVADRTVGLSAVNVVTTALYAREKTGHGQAIEVPMFETMTDFVLVEHLGGLSFDPPAGPYGYSRTLERARRPYKTLDGYIAVQVYTDNHWRDFFEFSGTQAQYGKDPRFADLGTRTQHVAEINAILAQIFTTRTTSEWLRLLNGADIPATPIHTVPSLIDDEHHKATGFFESVEHPSEGPMRSMRVPARWSGTPPVLQHHAPRLGEHSAAILQEIGYSTQDIARLMAERTVVVPPASPNPQEP